MKNKALFAVLAILYASILSVQAQSSNCTNCQSEDIQTLANSTRHFGFYGGIGARSTTFNGENLMMAGVRLGIIANRSLGIGFEGYGIIPTNNYPNITPNRDGIALGGYGGLTLEPIFFSNKAIHITFPVAAGAGWLGYHENWRNDLDFSDGYILSEDVFWYVEPGVNAELNISRALRLYIGVSKRFVEGLELINTPADSFNALNYSFGIKIGRF